MARVHPKDMFSASELMLNGALELINSEINQ